MEDLGQIIISPAPTGHSPQALARWTRETEQAVRTMEAYLRKLKLALESAPTSVIVDGAPTPGGTVNQVLTKNSSTDGDASWKDPHYPPTGGTINQVLAKISSTDYDYHWATVNGLPTGGTTGQALRKNSATNYDASFLDVHEVPAGGTTSQVLGKTSGTSYDATWYSILDLLAGVGVSGNFYIAPNFPGCTPFTATTLTNGLVTAATADTQLAIEGFEDYVAGTSSGFSGGFGWSGAAVIS